MCDKNYYLIICCIKIENLNIIQNILDLDILETT